MITQKHTKFNCCSECQGPLIQTESHYVCSVCGLEDTPVYTQSYKHLTHTNQVIDELGSVIRVNMKANKSKIVYIRLSQLQEQTNRIKNRKQNSLIQFRDICRLLQISNETQVQVETLFQQYQTQIAISQLNWLIGALYLQLRINKEIISLKELTQTSQKYNYYQTKSKILKYASTVKQQTNLKTSRFYPKDYLPKHLGFLSTNSILRQRVCKFIKKPQLKNYLYELQVLAQYYIDSIYNKNRGYNPEVFALACLIVADQTIAKSSQTLFYKKPSKRGLLTQLLCSQVFNIKEFTLREHVLYHVRPFI